MTTKVLSAPFIDQTFPAGTVEGTVSATVTGSLTSDGSAFSQVFTGDTTTVTADLPDGTYTYFLSKMGFSSLPSDSFTVTGTIGTVTFQVPDITTKANTPA